MNIKTTYSQKTDVNEVALEIKSNLNNFDTKVVLFFASSCYNQDTLSKAIKEQFNSSEVFGCTTAGEITTGSMLKNSVVVMAFSKDSIDDIVITVVENVKEPNNVRQAFKEFESYYGHPMKTLDIEKYVGIILIDGLTSAEENIMDKIGDLTNVTFIGGSAGDDLKFKSTYVFANGKSYNNAAVLALIKPKNSFHVIKTQSFYPSENVLIATKVIPEERAVIEFNNKPAAKAYTEALKDKEENAHNYFMTNPLGLMIDNEPYVRSPRIVEDNKMKFYCNVIEGMELSILQSTDMIKDTQEAIANKIKEIGPIAGLINFHCILRTLELEQKKLTKEYGNIFKNIPTIGFSTYGEEYIGHVNQTSTILVFK